MDEIIRLIDAELGAPLQISVVAGRAPNNVRWLRTAALLNGQVRPLPVSQQWQLSGRPAQIVSRLRPGVKLAEHFVHGVDDRLGLIQLNLVT